MKKISIRLNTIPKTKSSYLRVEARKKEYWDNNIIDFISGATNVPFANRVLEKVSLEFLQCSRYSSPTGNILLRNIVAEIESKKTGIDYKYENVLITNGVTGGLHCLSQTLLDYSDEIICLRPYWLLYPSIFNLACKFVVADSIEDIRRKINNNTVAIIINSPSFCDGRVLNQIELNYIVDIALEFDLIIISDEIYDYFYYKENNLPRIGNYHQLKDNLFILNAASKRFSAGGWRVGYIVGPPDIIQKMNWYQINVSYGASILSQVAYAKALQYSSNRISESLSLKRKFIVDKLNSIGIKTDLPEGGIGIFPKVSHLYKDLCVNGSEEFCWYLLKYGSVLIGPGIDCGDDERIYMSYSNEIEDIELGIKRIKNTI